MSQVKRARHQALVNDQRKLEDQLTALRSEQSAALIAGAEFSRGSEIRSLTDDIDALNAAIKVAKVHSDAEEARASAAARAKQRETDLAKFQENHAGYLAAAGAFAAAIQAAVAEAGKAHRFAAAMETFALSATGERSMPLVQRQNIDIRLSQLVCGAFAALDISGFGSIRWPPEHPRQRDAVAEERAQLAGIVQLIQRMCKQYIAEQTAIAEEDDE